MAGLPNLISKQLCTTGETTDLDKALERAYLLITMKDHQDQVAVVSENSNEVTLLKEQVANLTEQVALLLTTRQCPRQIIRCFYCDQPGHTQRRCPAYQSQFR